MAYSGRGGTPTDDLDTAQDSIEGFQWPIAAVGAPQPHPP